MTGRPRVGLIVPSSNPTVERLLATGIGPDMFGVDFVCTRIRVTHITRDASAAAQFAPGPFHDAAALLADCAPDLIVWAGTSGWWLGADAEQVALDAISAAASAPATSSRAAMVAAFDNTGVTACAVLTPYVPAVHAAVVDAFRRFVSVPADHCLGLSHNGSFAQVPQPAVHAELTALAGGGAVALVCTNMMALVPDLLVIDSLMATLWHAARLVDAGTATYADAYREVAVGAG